VAKATAAMILAGRMVIPPNKRRWMDLRPQLGLEWSRTDVGQASRPARNDLAPVAIVDQNEHAERYQRDFCKQAGTRQSGVVDATGWWAIGWSARGQTW
jgi:hypothetical protein